MSGYDAASVDDDRVAQAARRIVRQYHLQQSDRSEDSVGRAPVRRSGAPDDIQGLRLALDEMSQTVEHMQRLLVNREAVFMATLERIDRNLAKTDGRLDALTQQMARIESGPVLEADGIIDDQREITTAIMQDHREMLVLSRVLLDEVRDLHAASIAPLADPTPHF